MKRPVTREEFDVLTSPLRGLPVSHAWRGHATAIFLEFGKLNRPPNANNARGEFGLDLEWCWRIEKQRSIWFGSDSGDRRITNQLSRLKGAVVKDVLLYGRLPEIQINLEDRYWVMSFVAQETKPEWALFLPDGSWLHVVNGVLYNEDGIDAEP